MPKVATDLATDEPTTAQVLARLTDILVQGQEVQKAQLKQTAKKSNAQGPNISPYNLRGEKDFANPLLKCTVDCPSHETPTYNALDREEIELMNLLEPGDYVIEMVDGSMVPMSVIGQRNHETGKIEAMRFAGPFDEDSKQHSSLYTAERRSTFPSLKVQLRQFLDQRNVDHTVVMTMAEEKRRIKLPVDDPKYLPISLGE